MTNGCSRCFMPDFLGSCAFNHTRVAMVATSRNRRRIGMSHGGDTSGGMMTTYLLVPLHTSEWAWTLATRRDPIQVIAKTEGEARDAASMHFGLPSRGGRPGC